MRRSLLVFILLSIALKLYSQSNETNRPVPAPFKLPASPNTTSLGKYGDIPVALSTGQTNLSVDLYTIQEGDIQVPITLSYHNTGLQISEIPSWVGMGWDLNAGGVIIQSIKGFPDQSLIGMEQQNVWNNFSRMYKGEMALYEKVSYYERLRKGEEDSERDVYNYNFMGKTGSFYINSNLECVTIPKSSLKITYNRTNEKINFTIIDDYGFLYLFEGLEGTNSTSFDALLFSNFYNQSSSSGYCLTRIESPKGFFIDFKYKIVNIDYNEYKESFSVLSEAGGSSGCQISIPYEKNRIDVDINMALLEKIEFKSGSIFFSSNTIREDLKNAELSENATSLDNIQVIDALGNKIKRIDFLLEYFDSNKRLKLKQVRFLNPNTLVIDHKYSFNYYNEEETFPSLSRAEYGMDHWGYYNGKSNQGLVIAGLAKEFNSNINLAGVYSDASRKSNSSYAKFGMLKEVIYPTGGKTFFEYEANSLSYQEFKSIPYVLRKDINVENKIIYDKIIQSGGSDYTTGVEVTENLTIPQGENNNVKISAYASTNDPSGASVSKVELYFGNENIFDKNGCVQKINTTQEPYFYEVKNDCVVDLTPGNYTVKISSLTPDWEKFNGFARLTIEVPLEPSNIKVEVGGLRISKVTNVTDNGNETVKSYTYNQAKLRVIPQYTLQSQRLEVANNGLTCKPCQSQIVVYSENLSSKDGFHIEYAQVTELHGNGFNGGKIVHEYYNYPFEIGGSSPTFSRPVTRGWWAGTPKSIEYYESINDDQSIDEDHYRLLKKEVFNYAGENFESYSHFDQNFRVVSKANIICGICDDETCDNSELVGYLDKVATEFVPIYTEYFHLDNTLTLNYSYTDNIQKYIEVKKQNFYDGANKNFISKVVSANSKNEIITNHYKYTQDVSFLGDHEKARLQMISENKVGFLFETSTEKENVPIEKRKVYYRVFEGITLPEYTEKQIGTNVPFIESKYHKYDIFGNILAQSKANDFQTIILWGYNYKYPIAEISNSTYDEVESAIGGKIIIDELAQSFNIPESHLILLNQLREKLPNALITIYTYNLLKGVSSTTNPNGIITLYNYDDLGRLKYIKDLDNSIIKQYEYNYMVK